jgi:large subunit ribosomal protein L17
MKKKVFGRKFSRDFGSRRALFRALTRAFVLQGSIVTTKAKAKAIAGDVEKMVTAIKKGTLAHVRRVNAIVANDREVLTRFIDDIAPVFSDRAGGYTRIVSLPPRRGDRAEMARLTWTREIGKAEVQVKEEKSKKPSEKVSDKLVKADTKVSKVKKSKKETAKS